MLIVNCHRYLSRRKKNEKRPAGLEEIAQPPASDESPPAKLFALVNVMLTSVPAGSGLTGVNAVSAVGMASTRNAPREKGLLGVVASLMETVPV